MLSNKEFKKLIQLGSLFTLDLIVQNSKGKILLGLRKNEPAKGFWFVPGGRTFKSENLDEALKRISKDELGIEITKDKVTPIGIYEHHYEKNFFNEPLFTTHYIVLALKIKADINLSSLTEHQHNDYKFVSKEELVNSPDVHQFTKAYFIKEPENLFMKF